METKAIQDIYPEDYAWCYGCGRRNETGLHLKTVWDGEKTVTTYTPREEHIAIPGFVYGGLLASLIDCHGTGSASMTLHKKNGHVIGDGAQAPRFVTASLKVDFMKPTSHGAELKAIGVVEELHPKKFKVITEVYAGEVCCAKGEVIAAVMPDAFKPNR
ncbi:PaaI family thioesterase [Virgibacillus pantothenticus]|uniref:PaaI family thioesterase n=1 Tax=Virgibacillus pantothenticus TaxID=1473 RepID=UPI0025AF75BB|nr:PaaI family thioesterase [Virgibacillus pantothenticus]